MYVHKIWAEEITCSTVDSITNVIACVPSKIQLHSNQKSPEVGSPQVRLGRGFPLAGVNFLFAVPTLRPIAFNTPFIKPFGILLRNLILDHAQWELQEKAASPSCCRLTPSGYPDHQYVYISCLEDQIIKIAECNIIFTNHQKEHIVGHSKQVFHWDISRRHKDFDTNFNEFSW